MTDWDKVRVEYEAGENNVQIGKRHGVTEGAVRKKAKQLGWTKPYQEPKPKKQKLTIRERKFVKAVVQGRTPTAAMREAGYAMSTAVTKSSEKLRQLAPTIQEIMEKKGLTDSYLMDVLMAGTKATKVISANVIAPNGEGMKDANSMTKDFIDVEDFPTRHKYMETGLKLKGHLKDAIAPIAGMPASINIAFMRSDNPSTNGPRDVMVITKGSNGAGSGQ